MIPVPFPDVSRPIVVAPPLDFRRMLQPFSETDARHIARREVARAYDSHALDALGLALDFARDPHAAQVLGRMIRRPLPSHAHGARIFQSGRVLVTREDAEKIRDWCGIVGVDPGYPTSHVVIEFPRKARR